ncbi:MAG: bifunctional adenosylcobinamide kinase/adenosylcobinamide-phosphate guanylyltransferase [Rhodobacteraceae bacterium]|nr:MAG: bifunctional adenosylcobinamide kinase/adenosylcobinamide-phosphate guanylyltransferase [Paracoccaceae bacterium]
MYTNSENFKTHLVLGGARSGKTKFAEKLALSLTEGSHMLPIYIATAQAFDTEMQDRIDTHKYERADCFKTLECPLAIDEPLMRASKDEVILIDCLTLFVSNLLCASSFDNTKIESFKRAVKNTKARLIIVSNETGFGVVPDNKLARQFRDVSGKLNQDIASIADKVTMVIAGLGMPLKNN